MRLVFLMAVLAACGSVSGKSIDAGHDGPGSGGHMDAPADMAGDAAVAPITAIGASNVTQFNAPANSTTKIPYVADYDDLSEWNNTTSTFTAKNAGDYLVCASVFLGGTNLGVMVDLDLYKNGAVETILAQAYGIANACRTVRLAANDKLDFEIVLGTGAGTVAPDPNWQWMSIERVTEIAAVTPSAAFSSPNGQFVQIPYDTASVNDGTLYSTTTHQLTAPAAGDYQICAALNFGTLGLEGEIDLFVNGNREKALSNGVTIMSGCRSVRAAANDQIDVRVFQNTMNTTVAHDVNNADWLDIEKQPISVSVGAISDFTTTSHVSAQVPYSTVVFDDSSQYNTTTHTFAAATAGDYQVCASLLVPNSTTDGDEIDIYKNGTREKGLSYGHFGLSGCRVMRLAAGDQVQVWAYTQGDKSFTNNANWNWFEVSKLR
jgi:hypothetical protein